jgi:type IV pilus assembly protein PilC
VAEFIYKAKDPRGKVKSGKVQAGSKAQARTALARMRLKPISIKVGKMDASKATIDDGITPILGEFLFKDRDGKIQISLGAAEQPTDKDLIIFTKQFSTMISSGVPLMQALGILAQQQRVRSFGKTLETIRVAVENGSTLSEALEGFPKLFDTLYVAMVRAGEASGKLDAILLKLVSYIEKAAKIRSQVKSAMMYPMIVVVVAIVVVSALLIFVVPTFAKQYAESDKELPGLTAFVINLSNLMAEYWYVAFGAIFAGVFAFRGYIKTEPGRAWWDNVTLKLPGFGQLLKKIAVGRFCSTMATMLTSGVNLLEALSICAASAGNKTIETFVLNVRGRIEQGAKISEPLADGGLFPPMVVSMVAVGETTGALDEMLVKVSEFYEEEVDLAVKTLLSLIEPIMIVTIGGIVGIIVIAMYLPVFDMGNLVGA